MKKPSYMIYIPVEGKITIEDVEPDEVHEKMKVFFDDVTLDHFRGEYKGEKGLFFCDDIGLAKRLPLNISATTAYRLCCKPEAMNTAYILGPAVGLFGRAAE